MCVRSIIHGAVAASAISLLTAGCGLILGLDEFQDADPCDDGTMDGAETDVDCGGPACSPCADGKACMASRDCQSGACGPAGCAAATCSDGILNQDETDVDCGGTCVALGQGCGLGQACIVAADCQGGNCKGGTCAPPPCSDGDRNGAETDVDCGGPVCDPCADGATCATPADCGSGVCTAGVCQVPSCSDGVMNGSESDVDCGGACAKCGFGQMCGDSGDCSTFPCVDGICCNSSCTGQCMACNIPGSLGSCANVPLGQPDTNADTLCQGPTLTCDGAGACRLATGQPCGADAQCASDVCVAGKCQ